MVRLRLALDGRDVTLVCRDEAPPYDPRPALRRLPADLDEPVDKRGVGGLGNLLVGRLVDVSDYVRAGSANVLTLRFRRDASRSSRSGSPTNGRV
jgi:anti-sigma regulatory factor (Ser/Thr protein kinase)